MREAKQIGNWKNEEDKLEKIKEEAKNQMELLSTHY